MLGVLWQTVSQRTLEFGIRRAIGASAARVRQQIRGELVLLIAIGSVLGALFAIQAPLLGIHPHSDAGTLTVLLQDDVPGLEVERDGEWYPASR